MKQKRLSLELMEHIHPANYYKQYQNESQQNVLTKKKV